MKTDEERSIANARVLLQALRKYATGAPIIVVGTMKDKFLNRLRGEMDGTIREESKSDTELRRIEFQAAVRRKFEGRQTTFAERLPGVRIEYTAKGQTKQSNIFADTFFLIQSTDDANSIKSLLRTTLECLSDEILRVRVMGSQVCDVEQKIETAIGDSVRLCQKTVIITDKAPMSGIVVAPTMAWLVCNVALRAFGFGKVNGREFEEIMRELVWSNTDKLILQSLSLVAVHNVALALLGPYFYYILPSVAAKTGSARVVIACACDVILILEHAFAINGKRVWPSDIRKSAQEYRAKMGAVHDDIRRMIPTWKHVQYHKGIPQLREDIENIIQTHRQLG